MGNFTAPNFRYDAFSQTFTPYGFGYLTNPKEVHTIPASAPYEVYLNEIPRGDSPSTLLINEQGGSSFTEVSFATVPVAGQFRAIYGTDIVPPASIVGQGTIQFNSADAGKIIECAYYGLGAIMQNQFFNNLIDSFYGVPSFGSGLLTDTISEKTASAGVSIPSILKVDQVNEKTTNAGIQLNKQAFTINDDYTIVNLVNGATDDHDFDLQGITGNFSQQSYSISINYQNSSSGGPPDGSSILVFSSVGAYASSNMTEIHNESNNSTIAVSIFDFKYLRVSITNSLGTTQSINVKLKLLRLT